MSVLLTARSSGDSKRVAPESARTATWGSILVRNPVVEQIHHLDEQSNRPPTGILKKGH
jgi:hypothetical protein